MAGNSSDQAPLLPTNRSNVNGYGSTQQQAAQTASRVAQDPRGAAKSLAPSQGTQMKLAQIIGAFQAGKFPSQQQIDAWVDYLAQSGLLNEGSYGRTGALSDEGAAVVSDLKRVLKLLKRIGDEKNGDDKVQTFLYHCSRASVDLDAAADIDAPSSKELRADSERALNSVKTLGNLLVTSKEFRDILADLSFVARDLLADAASVAAEKASTAAEKARPSEQERGARGDNIDINQQAGKARDQAQRAKDQYKSGALQRQAQSGWKDVADSARQWIDENTPEDAKDEMIERLKKVIISAQQNREYHQAIDAIINIVKKYSSRAADAVQETDVEADDHVHEALASLRNLIETLAGGKSLDPLFNTASKVIDDVKGDQRLTQFADDVGTYLERLLHDEGYVTSQRSSRKADELYDRAQQLLENNAAWKEDASKLLDQLKEYSSAFGQDKTTSELLTALDDLGQDLAEFGSSGLNVLQAEAQGLWRDLFDVIVPRILSEIKNVPLPRIEYTSEDFDIVIDDANLAASGGSFIPDLVHFSNKNELTLEQGYAAFAANFDSSVSLRVEGLRVEAKDIAFYLHRKTGWFTAEDSGFLDIQLGGAEGLGFTVNLDRASDSDRESFFKVRQVEVDLDKFNFRIHQSRRPVSNFFLKPFIRPYLHSTIKNLLEEHIASSLQDADKNLFALQQRAVALGAYSSKAFSPYSLGGGSPSIAGYFKALFASSESPFKSSGKTKATSRGVVRRGRHGEYLLAIGADEQLLPGKGGPSGYAERKAALRKAQGLAGEGEDYAEQASALGDQAKDAADGLKQDAKSQGGKLDKTARKQKRKELRANGWRSPAFDI